MDNSKLCHKVLKLVDDTINEDNLLLSFITGSRASNSYNFKSDIDLFVILKKPSRIEEKALAFKLKKFHEINRLNYDHCGEIFSQDTIENILNNFSNLSLLVNIGFCESACFQSQCIFSIARKTLVVLHMLKSPKKMIKGDRKFLKKYEKIANTFFKNHSDIPITDLNYKLDWSERSELLNTIYRRWYIIMNDIENEKFIDTPLGISLERWFNTRSLNEYVNNEEISTKKHSFSKTKCPLQNKTNKKHFVKLFQSQCIGYIEKN